MSAIAARKPLILTPTKISTYLRCPLQYQLRYVERAESEFTTSPALERGKAAHAVLAQAYNTFREQRGLPIDLHDRVAAQLPRSVYADQRGWEEDVEVVVRWVKWVLAQLDGDVRVLATERPFDLRAHKAEDHPDFILRATIDVLVEHPDGSLEIIDFKAGAGARVDMIQMVASRIIVGRANRGRTVRNTILFLQTEQVHTEIIGRNQIIETAEQIRQVAVAITDGRDRQPQSNPLCDFCPFIGRCPLYADHELASGAGWLDGLL